MTALSVNIMKEMVLLLLSLLFFPSTWAACTQKLPLSITAPPQMEALSGTCLQIPCNFSTAGPQDLNFTRPLFGVWSTNHSKNLFPVNHVYNSSGTVTVYPMNITGNLSQKNCTTLFSNLTRVFTDFYFFRIENWPFMATAVCEPLQITIKDSPWSPRIEIPDDLKETQSVTITCSAFTPCPHSPPQLTWNLQQDSHNQIEQNTDGTFTAKIQQTITLSDAHDGNKISCSARYPVNEGKDTKTAETEVTLSVSYAPKQTSVSMCAPASVSAGSWVNLTCSSRAKPPVSSITWFKESRDGPVRVSDADIYSFNTTDGGVYYCVASNPLGTQTSEQIHVAVEGKQSETLFGVYAVLKTVGIILLVSTLLIFECWFRSRYSNKPEAESCQISTVTSQLKN